MTAGLRKCLLALAVFCALIVSGAKHVSAGFTTISSPDAGYLAETTLINPGAAGNDLDSISSGSFTVSFSATRTTAAIGGAWGTWSSSPNSESPNPPGPIVLKSGPIDLDPSSATLTFNHATTIFGLEIEPDDLSLSPHTVTVDFFNGSGSVGSISRDVVGNAGALLFAASGSAGTEFTKVTISSDIGFAFANVRYGGSAVPEPGSLIMLFGAGAVGLLVGAVRGRVRARSE